MKQPLRIKFDKRYLLDKLMDAATSPHKDTFVEKFIQVTDNWFKTKLWIVNEILPAYHNVEIHDFITIDEINRILSGKQFLDEVSVNNLIIQLKRLIYEVASKSIEKSDLRSYYDEVIGRIDIIYAL